MTRGTFTLQKQNKQTKMKFSKGGKQNTTLLSDCSVSGRQFGYLKYFQKG